MNRDNKIIIIDYQLGNLFSVKHACEKIGLNPIISNIRKEVIDAKAVILPGVGSFSTAMKNLNKLDLISPLKEISEKGTPILGICLGLQLLFEESEESGLNKGLGIIKGNAKKISIG